MSVDEQDTEAPAITVTPPTRTNGRWAVRVGRRSELVNPGDGTQVDRVAKKLGIDATEILDAIDTAQAAQSVEAEPPPAEPFVVRAWTPEEAR